MKYALVSKLSSCTAFSESGIGSSEHCAMVFNSRSDAVNYADALIRKNALKPGEYDGGRSPLREVQRWLGLSDLFHIFRIVEDANNDGDTSS